jgi:hypothetical protein
MHAQCYAVLEYFALYSCVTLLFLGDNNEICANKFQINSAKWKCWVNKC